MKQTLSYVLVTPYTVAKSRTGGVISRLLSQLDLELVAAQIIAPDESFVKEYAASFRGKSQQNLNSGSELLANYVEQNLGPSEGRRHRSLLLIFKGENSCRKLSDICGALYPENRSMESITGETIRDTYADLILEGGDINKVSYFEPAILTPRSQSLADENLELFSRFLKDKENIIANATYPDPSKIEQTLVILKPDNWKYASSRPGTIIDMFSRTGLRIVGIKVHHFSLSQAMEFYGPVEASLKERLAPVFGLKARETLAQVFDITLNNDMTKMLTDSFGVEYARNQFYQIIEFMSGRRPDTIPPEDAGKPGPIMCMILVYEGENAIRKIRDVLGPTDPLKAPGGTIRREFGSNVMVNTAHASDSVDNAKQEMEIVQINHNPLSAIIAEYIGQK
jgi:nucleoside diphosphate kinase